MSTFNLEEAIKELLKRLKKYKSVEPSSLEEIKSHLYDKIESLQEQGLTEEDAFEQAKQGVLKDAEEVANEFQKTRSRKPLVDSNGSWVFMLLPNFVKTSIRSMNRNRGFAFLNIAGLTIGLASCLLMVLYINHELSFDKFHSKKDRIYRVLTHTKALESDGGGTNITTGWPIGQILASDYPEIEDVVYIRNFPEYTIKHQGQYFQERSMIANQSFLDVFDFNVLEGNPERALTSPNQVVITNRLKQKYFGEELALGKTLTLQDSLIFTVSGVVEDIPKNSHITFDFLISFPSWLLGQTEFNTTSHWLDWNMNNYIMIKEGTDVTELEEKIAGIYMDGVGDYFTSLGFRAEVGLEPLTDIYLLSGIGNNLGPRSSLNTLYLLSGIAAFILLLACINFMNLSTARSLERAKEVGVRKTLGSGKGFLIGQFLSESTIMAFISMLFAIGLAIVAMPYFNELTSNTFVWYNILTPTIVFAMLGLIAFIGFLSGLYPAFVLSSFKPIQALKDNIQNNGSKSGVRKTLVTFQLAISCGLIVCTLVVFEQLNFMQSNDPGFNRDQVIVLNTTQTSGLDQSLQYELVKNELQSHSAIHRVSATQATPGRSGWRSILAYGEQQTPDVSTTIEYLSVDYDYVDFFGLELVAGRNFTPELDATSTPGVLVNEAALTAFGWNSADEALGNHVITINGLLNNPVIGVIKNYHQRGLQQDIQPAVYVINPNNYTYYAAAFNPRETTEVIEHLQSVWNTFYAGYNFEYFFLDSDYARLYRRETRLSRIYTTFAIMAILIACLGLFGLTAFSTSRRVKEIGIRKVFGASVFHISLLITKSYFPLIIISFLIAVPFSYLFMNNWLEDFAYRISIGIPVFVITFALIFLVTILTTGSQSLKAALANPVNSLKDQ